MSNILPMPSTILQAGFITLSIALLIGFIYAVNRVNPEATLKMSIAGVLWLGVTGVLGWFEVVTDFSAFPPGPTWVIIPGFAIAFALGFSGFGKQLTGLSVRFLIGYQAFRFIVELLIHQAVTEGIAPPQMTWTGLNLDIITGITAIPIAIFADRLPKAVLQGWNVLGIVLLAWVIGTAILSMPLPFQVLKPDNIWIAYFPFIWLPAIWVTLAILGHIVLYRKLAVYTKETVS